VPTIGDLTRVPSTRQEPQQPAQRRAPQQVPPQAAAWPAHRPVPQARRQYCAPRGFCAAIGHFDFGQARIGQQNRQLAHQRSVNVHAGLDVAARFSFVAHEILAMVYQAWPLSLSTLAGKGKRALTRASARQGQIPGEITGSRPRRARSEDAPNPAMVPWRPCRYSLWRNSSRGVGQVDFDHGH
jgi:hypothetical protein